MIRRYLARRRALAKQRWAVRRWKSWSPKQRTMFQFDRWQRRGILLQNEIAAALTTLHSDDPRDAPVFTGLPGGRLARKRQAKSMMANLTDAVAEMDEQDATEHLDNHTPLA